jgi:flagella basal body P-ring formation protein FlgA
MEDAVGLMVRHSIRQNTPLKEWMLERAPVLDKGAVVTILAQMGGLRVTVKGVALERGYPGEMVKVQNSMSQKTILARVMDSAHVMVEF